MGEEGRQHGGFLYCEGLATGCDSEFLLYRNCQTFLLKVEVLHAQRRGGAYGIYSFIQAKIREGVAFSLCQGR